MKTEPSSQYRVKLGALALVPGIVSMTGMALSPAFGARHVKPAVRPVAKPAPAAPMQVSAPSHLAPGEKSLATAYYDSEGERTTFTIEKLSPGRQTARGHIVYRASRGHKNDNNDFALPALPIGAYRLHFAQGLSQFSSELLVSDIGLINKRSPHELLVYAVSLSSGRPRPGLHVEVAPATGHDTPAQWRATTGADGIAQFRGLPIGGALQVRALAKGDSRLSQAPAADNGANRYRVLFYTERPLYRPGQKVYFKGVVRTDLTADGRPQGGDMWGVVANRDIDITITDAANSKLETLHLKTNSMGSFTGSTTLRDEAALGRYAVEINIHAAGDEPAETQYNRFLVQAYRKPEYLVTATPMLLDAKAWAVQGTPFDIKISARYYFGGAVKSATLKVSGDTTLETKLDDNGEAIVHVDNPRQAVSNNDNEYPDNFWSPNDGGGSLLRHLHFDVIDASNRIVSADTSVATPPAEVMSTLTNDKYLYSEHETAKIAIDTVDPSGKAISADGTLKIWRFIYDSGHYRKEVMVQRALRTDSRGMATVALPMDTAGYWSVEAQFKDAAGRESRGLGYVWVMGAGNVDYYGYQFPALKVALDKTEYRPGETVQALITTSTPGKMALVTLEGDRVFMHRLVPLKSRATSFKFAFPAEAAPGAHLCVGFPENGQWLGDTAYVKAPDKNKMLQLTVTSKKHNERPGSPAELEVSARDHHGNPVRAEVSLALVDKAIYGLASDETPKPFDYFYGSQVLRVATNWYLPQEYEGGAYQRIEKPVAVREKFADTAYWNPFVETGGDGKALLRLQWPDNLTTWRATARAITAGTAVGETTGEILVSKPLLVRLTLPRFFVQGDHVQALAIVNNNSKFRQHVRVSLRSDGADLEASQAETSGTETGTIEAGKSATFRWMVSLPQVAPSGTASFTATVRGDAGSGSDNGDHFGGNDGHNSDAMKLTLPVKIHAHPSHLTETGVLDSNNHDAQFTLRQPAERVAGTPSMLKIDISPSLAGPIMQALPQLIGFPYGCVEQTMSRYLPTVVASRVFGKIGYPLPGSMKETPKMVKTGLAALTGYQHDDGGWGWWKEDVTDPYMTGYVMYGLGLTQEAGYPVDRAMLIRGMTSIRNQFHRDSSFRATTNEWGNPIPRVIDPNTRAFMLLGYATAQSAAKITTAELGYKDDLFGELYAQRNKMTTYGLAAFAVAEAREGRGDEVEKLIETLEERASSTNAPAATKWDGEGGDWQPSLIETWCDSSIEATAFATQALVLTKPGSPLIKPALDWLLAQRTGDIWQSTKDTSQVIVTFADYMAQSHELSPDENVTVSVNGKLVKKFHFDKDDIGKEEPSLMLSDMAGSTDVELHHEGSGDVHYIAQLQSYSQGPPADSDGLKVERSYAVRDAKGNWVPVAGPIANGGDVRVELRITTTKDREYLLLEDPLPSGFEAEEYADAGVQTEAQVGDFFPYPLTRRDTRDDQIDLFSSFLWGSREDPGRYIYRYVIRPEQIGTRTAPAAHIETMYHPDTTAWSEEKSFDVKTAAGDTP